MSTEHKKRLAAVAKKWRTAKPPERKARTDWGDGSIPKGSYQAKIAQTKLTEEFMVIFELQIVAGEYTGKRPADVTVELLWEPEDTAKACGIDIFKGFCQMLGMKLAQLNPAEIKKAIKGVVGKVVDISVVYRKGSKDGMEFQRVYMNGVVETFDDTVPDLSDNPPPAEEEADFDDVVEQRHVEAPTETPAPRTTRAKKKEPEPVKAAVADDEEWSDDNINWEENDED